MRLVILAAGAVLSLSACGGNKTADNAEANMAADSNMMMSDSNLTMDSNMGGDANMMGAGNGAMGAGGMDGNAATNATTENSMMQKDLNTNDRDINLANGM